MHNSMILITVLAIAFAFAWLAHHQRAKISRPHRGYQTAPPWLIALRTAFRDPASPPPRAEFCNIAEGVRPTGLKTYKADGAITTRYLCVKSGSDLNHVALVAAVTDIVLGIAQDEPAAAEDEVTVQLLGACPTTVRAVSGAAIAVNALIACMANGKVQTAIATQYAIGRALNSSAGADEIIEFDPIRADRVL